MTWDERVAAVAAQTRGLTDRQAAFLGEHEMRELVLLGGEPCPPRVGQDGIEDHEPLDRARQRRRLAMPIVGLANRGVERFVVDVKDVGAVMPTGLGGDVAAVQQQAEEVRDLPAMGHRREGTVLSEHADAGVQHDRDHARQGHA
jgi:hypothetical protein